MKLTVEIKCDNDAFLEAGIGSELYRILSQMAARISQCVTERDMESLCPFGLFDVNGNRVGRCEWESP